MEMMMQEIPHGRDNPENPAKPDGWRGGAWAPGPRGRWGTGRGRQLFGLVALLLLGDALFWRHGPGLSLAIFAIAVFAVATADLWRQRAIWPPTMLLSLGVAPVVEHVQPLSIAFLVASLLTALVWARWPRRGMPGIAVLALRRLRGLPVAVLSSAVLGGRSLRKGFVPGPGGWSHPPVLAFARSWAFPIGGTLVFAVLLMQANPLIGRFLVPDVDLAPLVQRVLFWLGLGLILWPLLDPNPGVDAPIFIPPLGKVPTFGINAASVLRALVMFNLLIGLQTLMDMSILIGGADLPDGMSYAAYARRGAYPLLAAVMLAGGVALLARAYLGAHRAMRPLMLVWLAQNVMLCGSAMMRLDLYVDAYGLTYMRIYAMIWMALVAAGLALTAWQVWRGRSIGWLVLRATLLGVGTLYVCAFVNFAQMIAEQNLSGFRQTDWSYLCGLGPMAAGPMRMANGQLGMATEMTRADYSCPALVTPRYDGWRDFSYRTWRVRGYVSGARSTGHDE
jgi:hypothetical protein